MKTHTLICLILSINLVPWYSVASTPAGDNQTSLQELDALLLHGNELVTKKELDIQRIRAQMPLAGSLEQQYEKNTALYQEYMVYDSDSAMAFINRNLRIAEQLGRRDLWTECKIEKSFIYSATGLLKEAEDELQDISTDRLSRELRLRYYGQKTYLYSHFSQYQGHVNDALGKHYFLKEMAYRDSIQAIIRPADSMYLWYRGWWEYRQRGDMAEVTRLLREKVDASSMNSRYDAMNAYMLAILYQCQEQQELAIRYLIFSAMADVRIANRDIASLKELGDLLFADGDLDRAYAYFNYCLQQAQYYKNRIRILDMTQGMNMIHRQYLERNIRQQQRVKSYLLLTSLFALVLLGAIFYITRLMRKLKRQRQCLKESNKELADHVEELSHTRQRLTDSHAHTEELNRQLEQAIEQLKALNHTQEETLEQLQESNYVKEEYLGYVFTMCSTYIDKLNEYRKSVNRKIKTGQLAELKAQTDTPIQQQAELKEFYRNFDTIFLNVYPNFVSDFNALLRPDEQIVLREGELLNTDLRIYALVRLGINDSMKIADFLHCSPQTVYNNRLKIRNKAIIAKENFAKVVSSLGKYGQNV